MTYTLDATPEARTALQNLRQRHGEVILHITQGCCDAGTPLVFGPEDLVLGARDFLIGEAEGVRVYQMMAGDGSVCPVDRPRRLDVEPGRPVGFSLDVGEGMRFVLR